MGLPEGSLDWLPRCWCRPAAGRAPASRAGPHLPAQYAWALVSCIVTPGFDFADFEIGERDQLLAEYPQHGLIGELT